MSARVPPHTPPPQMTSTVSWARPGEMPHPSCNDQSVIPPGCLTESHLFCGRAGLALAACSEPVLKGSWSREGNKAVHKLTQCGNACSRNKRKDGAASPRDFQEEAALVGMPREGKALQREEVEGHEHHGV